MADTEYAIRGLRRMAPAIAPFYRFKPFGEKRAFFAFGVGLPRSGTHSLAYMLKSNFRAEHEPKAGLTIDYITAWGRGLISDRRAKSLLRARDRWLNLEFEAAHYLNFAVPLLVELFPEARFILTVRDPISWMRSELNQEFKSPQSRSWDKIAHFRYGRNANPKEAELPDSPRIYPLSSYLTYWNEHIDRVVRSVPESRLLILATGQLNDRIETIAEFLDIEPRTIDLTRKHSARAKSYRLDVFETIDRPYLEDLVLERCGEWMEALFPSEFATLKERIP